MEFTYHFIRLLAVGLHYALPILLFLILLIALMGHVVGRWEGWSRSDAIYFAFITATTVGYGDFRPQATAGKFLAIGIALVGMLLTGIIIAIGVKAAGLAFDKAYETSLVALPRTGDAGQYLQTADAPA